ncbi:MAG: sel1 repeat family protein [Deltaproteobacteria bacterium]|nr:MAG: sel1 repeat family protein [Deltaproteobacteria bacterium]TMB33395.1 MAG: sel1 repeat family protein [Deltaproteobacteria bacterium]
MRIRKRAILVVLAVVFVLFVANAVEGNLLNRAGAALKEENYPLALERIKPLAMLGDSTAQQLLGWMYAFGNGTPANPDEALKWFRRSSGWFKKDDGKVGAHAYWIARVYAGEEIGWPAERSEVQATRWFQIAADHGSSEAARRLAARTH